MFYIIYDFSLTGALDANSTAYIADMGFIAQELKEVQKETKITVPGLVYESNPDKLEASYGKLLPILTKAIQELSTENKSIKEENLQLKNKVDKIMTKLEDLGHF